MFWSRTVPSSAGLDPVTDTVIPFRFFDDTPLWRAFILYSLFVFDDVLDARKLRTSLEDLVERDGWHQLGARLRSTGGLAYHIPAKFTPKRPAIAFSHAEHDMLTSDHELARQLPRTPAGSQPTTICDPDVFHTLFQPAGAPSKLTDYLTRDIPQLGLHVVSFRDKTLVTLYWPHTLMDALANAALLRAWTQTLEARTDDVATPAGGPDGSRYSDPLADLGKRPTEPHRLASQAMILLGLLSWGLSNLLNFLRAQETRVVCVPATFLAHLHATAQKDLKADTARVSELETAFLSDNDVLQAWWARIALLHLPPDSTRTVNFTIAYSVRKAVGLADPDAPYVSNAVCFVNLLLQVREVNTLPLGQLALRIRRAVQELGTRAQVEAFAALWRRNPGRLPPFFGDRSMHILTFTSWAKAAVFEVDFSAAVVGGQSKRGSGNGGSRRRVGQPSYVQNCQFGLLVPNAFPIIGKDADGHYWLSGYMNKGQWPRMEEEMARTVGA